MSPPFSAGDDLAVSVEAPDARRAVAPASKLKTALTLSLYLTYGSDCTVRLFCPSPLGGLSSRVTSGSTPRESDASEEEEDEDGPLGDSSIIMAWRLSSSASISVVMVVDRSHGSIETDSSMISIGGGRCLRGGAHEYGAGGTGVRCRQKNAWPMVIPWR